MKKLLILAALVLTSCASKVTPSDPFMDTLDSLHNYDQALIVEEFGDSGILVSREVVDSLNVINIYEVKDTTVVYMHNLADTTCVEEVEI